MALFAELCLSLVLLLAGRGISAQTLTAEQIMARVAKLQDQAQVERTHYVYTQIVKAISRHGQRIRCEEVADYGVVPSANGSQRHLLRLHGRYWSHQGYVDYSAHPPTQGKLEGAPHAAPVAVTGDEIDVDMVDDMRSDILADRTKDGIDSDLFPLTSKEQANYRFRLVGQEHLNGRRVFHIEFRPADPRDFRWKGDAWIDTATFQPVAVSSGMSRGIPLAIRTLLGTNVPGLGFTVVYAPQPDGVWFPVSFSTEFGIHVLFFFRRTIIIDAENRDFERTHVTTRIVGSAIPVAHARH
jgi:hypothetical protein